MKRDTLSEPATPMFTKGLWSRCTSITVKARIFATYPRTYGFQNHGASLSGGDPADRRSLNASFSPTGPM